MLNGLFALIGAAIGSLAGVIPSILTYRSEIKRFKKRLQFDERMVYVKIYEESRKQALEDYLNLLGAMGATSLSGKEHFLDNYLAAYMKASLYLPDDVVAEINSLNPRIAERWTSDNERTIDFISDESYLKINRLIHNVLLLPVVPPLEDTK